jgi:hypothetical protein
MKSRSFYDIKSPSRVGNEKKIPNYKSQITNKLQIPNYKFKTNLKRRRSSEGQKADGQTVRSLKMSN